MGALSASGWRPGAAASLRTCKGSRGFGRSSAIALQIPGVLRSLSPSPAVVEVPIQCSAARVSRVRVLEPLDLHASIRRPPLGVRVAGVSHEDGFLLHAVAALAARRARVDGVAVVEAAADGVAFDDLEAHAGFGTRDRLVRKGKMWDGRRWRVVNAIKKQQADDKQACVWYRGK